MILRILSSSMLAAFLLVVAEPPPIDACAPAPPRNTPVAIADESAIIVWDAATKTEHFIRKASFKTEAKDFGFLVPTPTQPTLSEANDAAFTLLAAYTAPEIETQPKPSGGCMIGCAGSKSVAVGSAVRVLDETTVAGYDAAVLEADNAAALGDWLKARDYPFSPALQEWVKPYIAEKWKITAFKIAKPASDKDTPPKPGVGTSAVKMSFRTEKPFFPYREPPEDANAGPMPKVSRLLRVYFLGEKRMQGTIGEGGTKWPGSTAWANRLDPKFKDGDVFKQLKMPASDAAKEWYLTEFEDASSPRPGTADLFFSPSEEQSPVARQKHIRFAKADVAPWAMTAALAALMLAAFVRGRWK